MEGETPTLIKYSNPFLIYQGTDSHARLSEIDLKDFIPIKQSAFNSRVQILDWVNDLENNSNIEEVLNTIISSLITEDQGKIWLQTPVSFPATNIEVVRLKENLDKCLVRKGAKLHGICHVREDLYFQCLDEIIRQVIINYKRRGLLLFCVKEHFKNTLKCYRNLFFSSCAFGISKEIKGEKQKAELRADIARLEAECARVEVEVQNLADRIETRKEGHKKKMEVGSSAQRPRTREGAQRTHCFQGKPEGGTGVPAVHVQMTTQKCPSECCCTRPCSLPSPPPSSSRCPRGPGPTPRNWRPEPSK